MKLPGYIKFIKGDYSSSNSYLIKDESCVLIDPGSYSVFNKIMNFLNQNHLTVNNIKFILNTHSHPDHCKSNKIYTNINNSIKIYIHKNDSSTFKIGERRSWYKNFLYTGKLDNINHLTDGNIIYTGRNYFEVIHTPGHTPGSICLYNHVDKILFSGDTILNNTFGQLNARRDYFDTLTKFEKSIEKLQKLDIKYILPGHGDIITDVDENFSNILKKIKKLKKRPSYFAFHSIQGFLLSKCHEYKRINKKLFYKIIIESEWYESIKNEISHEDYKRLIDKCAYILKNYNIIIEEDNHYVINENLVS